MGSKVEAYVLKVEAYGVTHKGTPQPPWALSRKNR